MEKKAPPPFSALPASAKKGILFLLVGWICHFFFIYKFFGTFGSGFEREMVLQQAIIAILVCFFTIRVRNWARVLCIVCNIVIITFYLFVGALFFESGLNFFIYAVINVILFSAATFFLMVKETSDFYKLHSPQWSKNKAGSEKQSK